MNYIKGCADLMRGIQGNLVTFPANLYNRRIGTCGNKVEKWPMRTDMNKSLQDFHMTFDTCPQISIKGLFTHPPEESGKPAKQAILESGH